MAKGEVGREGGEQESTDLIWARGWIHPVRITLPLGEGREAKTRRTKAMWRAENLPVSVHKAHSVSPEIWAGVFFPGISAWRETRRVSTAGGFTPSGSASETSDFTAGHVTAISHRTVWQLRTASG
ncbi:hypothetical protein N7540_003790 [Penicillium herquei]|nr:hypothetical protein N7540_003790 [Penicillium herquei]